MYYVYMYVTYIIYKSRIKLRSLTHQQLNYPQNLHWWMWVNLHQNICENINFRLKIVVPVKIKWHRQLNNIIAKYNNQHIIRKLTFTLNITYFSFVGCNRAKLSRVLHHARVQSAQKVARRGNSQSHKRFERRQQPGDLQEWNCPVS